MIAKILLAILSAIPSLIELYTNWRKSKKEKCPERKTEK
jgi:hypothetical protein